MLSELGGVIIPVITPVDREDRVDEAAFRGVIRHVVDASVHGVFVGGSAGEGPLLTLTQWTRMVEIAFDEVRGTCHLLAGTSETSTRRVFEKIDIISGIGYKNFVVTPTFYITLKTPDEHLRLFGACKDRGGDMEMIAYNIPACTGAEIPVETMCDITRRGWIRYCKESSGNAGYFGRLMEQGAEVGLKAFMGDEALASEGLLAGACGIVPVCGNYEPRTFIQLFEAAKSGDTDRMATLQDRVVALRRDLPLASACWIAGVKHAMAGIGLGSGKPVSPLQPGSILGERQEF